MFNKKKKVQKAFKTISGHIDSQYTILSHEEWKNLHGLLNLIKIKTGVVR